MKDAAIGHQYHADYKQVLRKRTQQFLPFSWKYAFWLPYTSIIIMIWLTSEICSGTTGDIMHLIKLSNPLLNYKWISMFLKHSRFISLLIRVCSDIATYIMLFIYYGCFLSQLIIIIIYYYVIIMQTHLSYGRYSLLIKNFIKPVSNSCSVEACTQILF